MRHLAIFFCLAAALFSRAEDTQSFRAYVPSRTENALILLKITPDPSGRFPYAEMRRTDTIDLGFGARTIAQHGDKPILYLSGAPDRESGTNLAVVYLDPKTGEMTRSVRGAYERDYSYLSVDRSGNYLLGCNYGKGIIDVYSLKQDGSIQELVSTTDEGRSAAHCVLPTPDNGYIYIPYVKDSNALYQYRFDAEKGALMALDPKNAEPPEGTGPRHLVYHPDLPLLYFSEEQGLGVSVYRRAEDGQLTFVERVRAVGDDAPTEGVSSSDIVMTPNGKYIFTGIRGHQHDFDHISAFAVKQDGTLKPVGLTKTSSIPWGLAVSPDGKFLLVTAFKGAEILLYRIGEDGALKKAATLPVEPNISDIETRAID